MSLFVQTNVTSLKAQENFSKTQLALSKTMQKLSSGYKINSAADDAAGLGISMRLNSQVASYSAATQNANTAIAMTQTADGGAAPDQRHPHAPQPARRLRRQRHDERRTTRRTSSRNSRRS